MSRLEEILDELPISIRYSGEIEELKEFAREQVKRTEELEGGNNRYKEALEFYANEKTYNLGVQFSMGSAHPRHEPIKYDKGEKARKALEESE